MLEPKLNRELCWDACREELLKVLHTFEKDKTLAVMAALLKFAWNFWTYLEMIC